MSRLLITLLLLLELANVIRCNQHCDDTVTELAIEDKYISCKPQCARVYCNFVPSCEGYEPEVFTECWDGSSIQPVTCPDCWNRDRSTARLDVSPECFVAVNDSHRLKPCRGRDIACTPPICEWDCAILLEKVN